MVSLLPLFMNLRIFIGMRFILPFMLCLFVQPMLAQKQETSPNTDYKDACVFTQPKVKLGGSSAADAQKYLVNTVHNLKADKVGLVLKHTTQSPGGYHYSYMQTYAGVEVYQAEVKANVDRGNMLRSVLDNSFDTRHWNVDVSAAKANSVIAVRQESGEAVLAEVVQSGKYEQLLYNGEVLYSRDVNSYVDSNATGKVFFPDPLTTAQQNYGGIYLDNGDSNATWLTNQLRDVTFKADYSGGQFRLQSNYLIVQDFGFPNIPVVTSANGVFNYNRSQSGFEDVNVFYHISRYRNHVDSLGFDMANHLVYADPHGLDENEDQSYFSPGEQRLYFGMGGVDDAEDADVIIHEYGHFLSNNAAPSSNNGGQERNALDEAFGDYLAVSYSARLGGTFNPHYVFNWDGHNEFWNGRVVNSNKMYPADNTGSIYARSGIWSAVLWGLHEEIGGLATDSLIYEAHYNYANGLTMPNAAKLLIEADTVLTGGRYYCPIYKHLMLHGLAAYTPNNPCGYTGIDDADAQLPIAFIQQPNAFAIVNSGDMAASFEVLSLTGQKVVASTEVGNSVYHYSNTNLPSGMYVVLVNYDGVTKGFKWLK